MSLKITKIEKVGEKIGEYILFQATEDLELSKFAVIDTTYNEGEKSNRNRHFYKFPLKEVKKKEYVALFTGKGVDRFGETKSGNACHYLYWGLENDILNNGDLESIEVLEIKTIVSKKVA